MTFNKLSFEEQAIISMKRKNMTLGDIGKELNISIPYVSDILKGNRSGGKHKERIAEILEIQN